MSVWRSGFRIVGLTLWLTLALFLGHLGNYGITIVVAFGLGWYTRRLWRRE